MSQLHITGTWKLMPWHLQQEPPEHIEISEEPFDKGGYGTLYEVETPLTHSLPVYTKWVVKLCSVNDQVNKIGFERINHLSDSIRDWQKQNAYDADLLMLLYPPLLGFPQALFTCKLDDEECFGYLMPNLRSLGYQPFADLIANDPDSYFDSLRDPSLWQLRLKGVFGLSRTLGLLHDAFDFLHGDLKAESIWCHPETNQFILIDFDGGSFRKIGFKKWLAQFNEPQIKGTIQAWLAPEIMKAVDEDSGEARFHVSSASDLWSFACCSFHLLTGFAPFGFLSTDIYASRKNYLEINNWPSLTKVGELLSFSEEEMPDIEAMLRFCQSKNKLWLLWEQTFNNGFRSIRERPDYDRWIEALNSEVQNKTSSIHIKFEPAMVLEGTEAVLNWKVKDGHLFINGVNKKREGRETFIFHDYPALKLVNEFGEWPVSIPFEIVKKPRILSFKLSSSVVKQGTAVSINCDVVHSDLILLTCNRNTITIKDSKFEFTPVCSQDVTLQVISKYGLHKESQTVPLKIVKPVEIEYFTADREFIAETLPITFSWNVCNADKVSIEGSDRVIQAKGEIVLRPKLSGEVILKAYNQFFSEERSIYIEVLPVPKIDNLHLPQLPKMNIELPDLMSAVPRLLEHLGSSKSAFNKIFDDHEKS